MPVEMGCEEDAVARDGPTPGHPSKRAMRSRVSPYRRCKERRLETRRMSSRNRRYF